MLLGSHNLSMMAWGHIGQEEDSKFIIAVCGTTLNACNNTYVITRKRVCPSVLMLNSSSWQVMSMSLKGASDAWIWNLNPKYKTPNPDPQP